MGRFKPYTIKPASGGALVNVGSAENVGAENYTEKVNFRRIVDREARREGWNFFNPNEATDLTAQRLASLYGTTITRIAEAVQANGERLLIAASKEKIFRFNLPTGAWVEIGAGYAATGKRWEVVEVAGEAVFNNGVDLPFTLSVQYPTPRPIHELRERGVASVGTIAEYFGFLHCFDVREIIPDQLNAWMNGATPYGPVPDAQCNRFRYRHIWSEFGRPRDWAPVFSVTLNSASTAITLPFPSSVFHANETRVAVIGGGVNGGTLGGETGYESGVLVTSVAGATIALEKSTATLTYPRQVKVCRFADVSSIVGYNDITDDGSAVLKALPLRDTFVLYRETGIFIGRYSAQMEQPFPFKRAFRGKNINVPYDPDTLIDVEGLGHLFAGRKPDGEEDSGGHFFLFDGVDEPRRIMSLDVSSETFFKSVTDQASAFACHQPNTGEIWFCSPTMVLAYDVTTKTCSEIDAAVTAAALVKNPAGSDKRFVLATGGALATYGGTFFRFGAGVAARITFGLWSMGDEWNDKEIRGYSVLLSNKRTPIPLVVSLDATHDASVAPERLFSELTQPG